MSQFLITAYIRHSYATDLLRLPEQHPLYHKHACLVISDLTYKTAAAHGFGFNGYIRESLPQKSKIIYKQALLLSKNEAKIDLLYRHLTSRYAPNYSIEHYNCVDHLHVCLKEVGIRSKLLEHFKHANSKWYKQL